MKPCESCQTPHSNQRFCSRACSSKTNNRNTLGKSTCSLCDTPCGVKQKFCRKHQAIEESREISLAEVTTWYKEPSNRFTYVRQIARLMHLSSNAKCAVCGYSNHVEVCHIKPLSSFPLETTLGEVNDENNIILLCPNHHWEFDRGRLSPLS